MWNRISHLKTRHLFVGLGALIILALLVVIAIRIPIVREKISPLLDDIKYIKLAPITSFDKVVLKNGTVFEGKIISEDDRMIVLELNLKQGEGSLRLERSQISKIKYAAPR